MMNCPLCVDEVLDVTHHHGIEIDICPRCRGLWLDRGELDRLLGTPDDDVVDQRADRSDDRGDGFDEEFGFRDSDRGRPDRDRDRGEDRNAARTPKQRRRRLLDKLGDALEEVLDI
jgi:uncharacterized protein